MKSNSDEIRDAITRISNILDISEERIGELLTISRELSEKHSGLLLNSLIEVNNLAGFTSLEKIYIAFSIASYRIELERFENEEQKPTIDIAEFKKNPLKAIELEDKQKELRNGTIDVKFTIDEICHIDTALFEYFENHKNDEDNFMQNNILPHIVDIGNKIHEDNALRELGNVLDNLSEYRKYEHEQWIKAKSSCEKMFYEHNENPDNAMRKVKRDMSKKLKIEPKRLDEIMNMTNKVFYANDNMIDNIVLIQKLKKVSVKEKLLIACAVGSLQKDVMNAVHHEREQKRADDSGVMFV